MEEAAAKEKAEADARFAAAKEVQRFQRQQAEAAQQEREARRRQLLKEDADGRAKLAAEDAVFMGVLEEEIARVKAAGRDARLLEKLRQVGSEDLIAAV